MITPAQTGNPQVKPKWQLPVGVMEGVVAYNCKKQGFPRPVLAMPLWEGAGAKAIDFSGHQNHGTLEGMPTWKADGKGLGLNFDGVADTDRVTIADADSLDVTTQMTFSSSLTISSITSGWGTIVSKFDGASQHIYIVVNSASLYLVFIGIQNGWDSGYDFVAGKPTDLVITFDSVNGTKVYIDGNYFSAEASGGSIQTNANPLYLGHNTAWTEEVWDGDINNALMWDVVLTPAQIRFLHDDPYFMYRVPEELCGYTSGAPPTTVITAIMDYYKQMRRG